MNDLVQAVSRISEFRGGSLRKTIAALEASLAGLSGNTKAVLQKNGVTEDLLSAALLIKQSSSQIDEVVHAVGTLMALPRILSAGETVEALSLAAGNTGKGFDLETNLRIAEFTFIQWQGGPEVIRQNKIFKDFYFLAEAETSKIRELYVIGLERPMKFFNSSRSLSRIVRGNAKLGIHFQDKYGDRFKVVRDYFVAKQDQVQVRDLRDVIPILAK